MICIRKAYDVQHVFFELAGMSTRDLANRGMVSVSWLYMQSFASSLCLGKT